MKILKSTLSVMFAVNSISFAQEFQKTDAFENGNRKIIPPSELFKTLGFDKPQAESLDLKEGYSVFEGHENTFKMLPIKGGRFKRGGTDDLETPVRDISVSSFFMGQHEVTWTEYETWQFDLDINKRTAESYTSNDADKVADIVSRPTAPYVEMSFGMGKEKRPAICMTQLAAKMYCVWLSAKTGDFYRLPTEAEWEYACRAGSITEYSFGDDPTNLGEYAWYVDNANGTYQEVGTKKPNAFGLYDMHGNVAEWVLDSYLPDFYANSSDTDPVSTPPLTPFDNPFEETEKWPNKIYDRVVRGGSYSDNAEDLDASDRLLSTPMWKILDPQIPKSVWYHTNARMVGFRVVRATPPKLEDLSKYWPSDEEVESIPVRGE